MKNDLTPYEKLVLYNMVFDRYYSVISQNVSPDIYKQHLQQWEVDLWDVLEKLKQQGWNTNGIQEDSKDT